ncbi:protein-glutamine glutaminase family protein [Streptomyces sp. NPDC048324]|uniref:protein-glutamine glutaminase family protein n=1 Tax=Streptomyces sp. NPDC048324 TaxID=3157205 RepID=UPI0034315BF2
MIADGVPQLRDRVAKWLTGDSPEAAARRAELDAGPDPIGVLLNDLDLPALETLLGEPAPELPREEVERIEQNLMRPQYLRALIDQFANPADRAIVGGFTPGMAARFLPGFVPDREKIDKASLQRLVRDRRTTRLRDLAAERLRTGHPSSQALYKRLIARHPGLVRVYPELAVMLKTPTSEVVALAVRSTDMWTSPFYDRMPELTAAALDLNITTVQTFEGMSDLTHANPLNPAAARSLHVFYEGGVHYSAMNRVGGPAPAEQPPVISQAARLTESPVVGLPPAAPWDVDENPGLPLLEGALRAAGASESLVARLGGLKVDAVNQLNRMLMAGPQQNAAISAADVARARRKGRSTKPRATAAPVTVPFTMGSTEISEEQRHRLDALAVLVAEQARTNVLAGVSLPVVRVLGRGRGARFAFARRSPRDVARSREEAVERHLRDRLTQVLAQQPSARHPLTGDDFRFEAAGDEQPSLDDVDTAERDAGEAPADSVDVQVDFTPEPTPAQEEIAPELIAAKWAEVEHRVNPRRAVALSLAYHIVRTHQRVTGFQSDENPQFGELPLAHRAVYAVAVSLVDSPGDVDGAQALSRALAANQPAPSAPADTRGRDGGRSSRWTRDRSGSASRSASRSRRIFPAPSSAQPGTGALYGPMPAPVNSTSPHSLSTGGTVFTHQPGAPVVHHQHMAPAGTSAHSGPSGPPPSARALRLSNDLPSMDAQARAWELAALRVHERRWLSSHPGLVDSLKNALPAEEFALTAAQLLVHVPEAVRRPASARQEAHALLSRMLRDPEVTAQVLKSGTNVVVVAKDVPLTTLEQFQHFHGRVLDDGRLMDFLRGLDASSTAIPEESLLGEPSLPATEAGTADPDGYSSVVHEFAHAIHRRGLTAAEQQQIKKAYDDRMAMGPNASWPDGPRLDLDGVPTDNYSARNEQEYFAQLTNVYFGVNTGEDGATGRPRENGAEWVKTHESGLLPLLQRLYGPPEEAGLGRPVNPLQSNLREDEAFEGVRALFRDDSHLLPRKKEDEPPDVDELVRELPLLDDDARAQRLAALKPVHRRRLAADTALVDELSRTLSPESFADTAAQLMVEVLPGADRPLPARQQARALLARLLRDPQVAARLLENGVMALVLPRNMLITALPQYRHLSGRVMPNGLPFASLREAHGRSTVIPEESLFDAPAAMSVAGPPERSSSTIHTYAQTVYTFGLTDAERDWIQALYEARQRRGWTEQWPGGTWQDTPSAQTYFAQLTNVYLGVNEGRDAAGRPLPNGPLWVLQNEPTALLLLARLYGRIDFVPIDSSADPADQSRREHPDLEGDSALLGDEVLFHAAPPTRDPDVVVPGGRVFAAPGPAPSAAADPRGSGRGPDGASRVRGPRQASESRTGSRDRSRPAVVTETPETAVRRLPSEPTAAGQVTSRSGSGSGPAGPRPVRSGRTLPPTATATTSTSASALPYVGGVGDAAVESRVRRLPDRPVMPGEPGRGGEQPVRGSSVATQHRRVTQSVTVDDVSYEVLRVAGDGDCFPTSVLAGIARQVPDSDVIALDVRQLRDRVADWLTGDSPEAAARRAELDSGPVPVRALLDDLDLDRLRTLLGPLASAGWTPEAEAAEVARIDRDLSRPGRGPIRAEDRRRRLKQWFTARLRDLAAQQLARGNAALYDALLEPYPGLARAYPRSSDLLTSSTSDVVAHAIRSTDMWTTPFYDRMPEITAAALGLNIVVVQDLSGGTVLATPLNPAANRSLYVFYQDGNHYSAMNRAGSGSGPVAPPMITAALQATESPDSEVPPAAPWRTTAPTRPDMAPPAVVPRAGQSGGDPAARRRDLSAPPFDQLTRPHRTGATGRTGTDPAAGAPGPGTGNAGHDPSRAARTHARPGAGRAGTFPEPPSSAPRTETRQNPARRRAHPLAGLAAPEPVTVRFDDRSAELGPQQRRQLDTLAELVADHALGHRLSASPLPVVSVAGRSQQRSRFMSVVAGRDLARPRVEAVERYLRDRLTAVLDDKQPPGRAHRLTGDDFLFHTGTDGRSPSREDGAALAPHSVAVDVELSPEPRGPQRELAPERLAHVWGSLANATDPPRTAALASALELVGSHQRVTGFRFEESPDFHELPFAHRAVYAVAANLVVHRGDRHRADRLAGELALNQPRPAGTASGRRATDPARRTGQGREPSRSRDAWKPSAAPLSRTADDPVTAAARPTEDEYAARLAELLAATPVDTDAVRELLLHRLDGPRLPLSADLEEAFRQRSGGTLVDAVYAAADRGLSDTDADEILENAGLGFGPPLLRTAADTRQQAPDVHPEIRLLLDQYALQLGQLLAARPVSVRAVNETLRLSAARPGARHPFLLEEAFARMNGQTLADAIDSALGEGRLELESLTHVFTALGLARDFSALVGPPRSVAAPLRISPGALPSVRAYAAQLHAVAEQSDVAGVEALLRMLDGDLPKVWAVFAAWSDLYGSDLRSALNRQWPGRDFDSLFGVPSRREVPYSQLVTWCKALTNLTFDHPEHGPTRIPTTYPEGCVTRAHLWTLQLMRWGVSPRKIFVARVKPFLETESLLARDARYDRPGTAEWAFHVAPMVDAVRDGRITPMVVDPALALEPLTEEEWLRRLDVEPESYVAFDDTPAGVRKRLTEERKNDPQGWAGHSDRVFPVGEAVVVRTDKYAFSWPGPGAIVPNSLPQAHEYARQTYDRLHGYSVSVASDALMRAVRTGVDLTRHLPAAQRAAIIERIATANPPRVRWGLLSRYPELAHLLRLSLPDHHRELTTLFTEPSGQDEDSLVTRLSHELDTLRVAQEAALLAPAAEKQPDTSGAEPDVERPSAPGSVRPAAAWRTTAEDPAVRARPRTNPLSAEHAAADERRALAQPVTVTASRFEPGIEGPDDAGRLYGAQAPIGYSLRRYQTASGEWYTDLEVALRLVAGDGVTDGDLRNVARSLAREVRESFDAPGHRLPDGDLLRVRVVFADSAEQPVHHTVTVTATPGTTSTAAWHLRQPDGSRLHVRQLLHEVGHYIGLPDRYEDAGMLFRAGITLSAEAAGSVMGGAAHDGPVLSAEDLRIIHGVARSGPGVRDVVHPDAPDPAARALSPVAFALDPGRLTASWTEAVGKAGENGTDAAAALATAVGIVRGHQPVDAFTVSLTPDFPALPIAHRAVYAVGAALLHGDGDRRTAEALSAELAKHHVLPGASPRSTASAHLGTPPFPASVPAYTGLQVSGGVVLTRRDAMTPQASPVAEPEPAAGGPAGEVADEAGRLVADMLSPDVGRRARALAELGPQHRSWLVSYPDDVDRLGAVLAPELFAQAAAQLLVDVPEGVRRPVAARQAARVLVARMLRDPDVAARLLAEGSRVVVVPADTPMTELEPFRHLRGEPVPGGRTWDQVRGSGGRVSAITEENLLGESSRLPNTRYADGYSTTVHELAHMVHHHGLSQADRQAIDRAFAARRALGPDASWPDGIRRDREGRVTDNYSSRDADEFFAQLSNVYLGANAGLDPFTGRPRENGARWVEENEPGLLPLLRRLYGPALQEGELGPVNPVRAVQEEDETLAAVRVLFHGEQVVAPDSWTEPRATASWTGRDRSESSHDKEQLPPPPPSGMTHLMPVSGTPVGDLAGWPGPLSPTQREEVLRQVGTFLVTGRLSAVRVVLHRLNRRSDQLRGTQYEGEAARLANRVAWDLDRAERGPGLQSPPKVINFLWIGRPMSESAVTNVLRWAELARQHGWIVQMWTDTAPVSAARPTMLSTWDPAVFRAMEAAGVRFRAVESLLPPDRPAGWKNGRFDRGFTLQNPRMLKLRTMYNNARLHPGAFPVASDLVRIGIMLYEGGAYFDVDMEPGGVELFTEARKMGRTDLPVIGPMFRDARVFAGQRADFAELLGVPAESVSMEDVARYAMRHAMFGNAFMMAVPGSRFFERAIDAIGDEAVQWGPEALATSGAFLTGPFLYHRVAAQQVASYGLGEVADAETGAAMDQQELGRWARLGWLTAESENQVDRPVGQAPIPSQNSGDDIRSRLGRGPRHPRGGAGSGAGRSAGTFAPPPSESETRTPGGRSGLADGLSGVPVTGGSVFVQRPGTPSPARWAAAGTVTERSSDGLASEIRAATDRDPEGESESAPETRTAPDAPPSAARQPLTVPFARGSRTVDAGQDRALRELARTLAAQAVRNHAEGLTQPAVRVSGRGNSTGHASFTGRTRAKNTAWILEAHLAAELRELQGAAPDPVTVRDLDIRYGYEDTSEQKRLDPHDRRTATVTVGAAAAPEGVEWTPLRESDSLDRHELAENPLTVTFGKGDKDVSARDSRHIADLAKRIAVRAVRAHRAGLRPPVIRIPGRGNGPDAETTGLLRAANTRRELEKFLKRELQRLQPDDATRPLTPADIRIFAQFDDAPKALYEDPLTHRTATIRVDWPSEGTPEPEDKPLPPLPPSAEAEDKALPPLPPTDEPGNQEGQVEEAPLFMPEWGEEEDDSGPVRPPTTAEERVRTGVVRQVHPDVTVVAPWQTGEEAAVHGTVTGTEPPYAVTSAAVGTGYTRGPAPDTVVGPAGTVLELRPEHGPGNGLTEAAMGVVGDDLPDWFRSDGTPDQDMADLIRADLAAQLTEADLPQAFASSVRAELTTTAEELTRAGVTLTERPDGVIRVGPADLTPLQYTRLLLTRPELWDPAVDRIAAAGLARLLMLDLTLVDLDTGTESRFSGGLSQGVLVLDGGRFRLAVPRRDASAGTSGDDIAGTDNHPSTHL